MTRSQAAGPVRVVVSCEHASCRVPSQLTTAFRAPNARAALASHRGWDPGSAQLARCLARRVGAPVFVARQSRLVVDLNRSLGHPRLHSEWVRALPPSERAAVVARYYSPFRHQVEAALRAALASGRTVIHLGAHSFTPVLDGKQRRADIGILYDPAHPRELGFAKRLQRELAELAPTLDVRRNYPYRGSDDGFTTSMRRTLPRRYLGIEIELNQRHLGPRWAGLCRTMSQAVVACLRRMPA